MVEQEVLDCMEDLIKKVEKKEYKRQWDLNNKEKQKEYRQTESGMKSTRIGNWKKRGIITDDYDAMYDHYIQTSFCDECKIELTYDKHITKTTKCLDHDHNITDGPNFRNILCHPCNIRRR